MPARCYLGHEVSSSVTHLSHRFLISFFLVVCPLPFMVAGTGRNHLVVRCRGRCLAIGQFTGELVGGCRSPGGSRSGRSQT